jgi:Flp pilus assembly protein TadD
LAAGLVVLAAACAPRSDFTPDRLSGSRLAVDEAVDGLLVGHRLMAAGEYELALRAYFRAAGERGADVDTLSAIGAANLRLGRLGQAEQALRRALDRDADFIPALNNLGVVMAEHERWGEARHLFQAAFALDSGRSAEIRENLRLALAKLEDTRYSGENEKSFALVRRGDGRFLLLTTP